MYKRQADQDVGTLTRLPGIGKKTAERLIVEMQDRIQKLPVDTNAPVAAGGTASSAGSLQSQAISALEALGFKNTEARKMVKSASGDSVEDIIKDALKAVSA